MSDNQQARSLNRIPSRSVTIEVIDQLQEAIRKRVFSAGEKLPGEPKLAEQLGVSRNTLREAINSLIEKGILFRQRGVGTFVTAQPDLMLKTNLEQVVGTSDLIREQGRIPGQKDFCWVVEPAATDVARHLKIKSGSKVIHISRIRTADNVPVIQADEYIPLEILGDEHSFARESSRGNWSIYNFLKEFGFEIHSAVTRVVAVTADEKMADELDIRVGQPLLCLEQTHYSNNHLTPILYCVNFHNEKLIDVVVIRKG